MPSPTPASHPERYRSILLPLDGSSFSEEAVPLARLLAATFGAEIHLVHVIRDAPDMDFKTPQEDLDWRATVRDAASDAMEEIASGLASEGVRARVHVREGPAVDSLLEQARESRVDLVVLTTHGRGGFARWWLGSTADGVLRSGGPPVLLVRPWDETLERAPETPRFRTVLVPLDGSPESEVALEHAASLASRFESRLVLVQVVPSALEVGTPFGMPWIRVEGDGHRELVDAARDYLEGVAERLRARGGTAPEVRVAEASSPAEGILEAARSSEADLLVLATRGRGGIGRVVLGSVADKVIRGTALPVLAVHPPEA
jgi:nucleotide-binding universal stress UspA family protein